jgi:Phage integrase family
MIMRRPYSRTTTRRRQPGRTQRNAQVTAGQVKEQAKGAPLRRTNFRPIWVKACVAAGASGVHFHELRHTGGTLAATTGATTKELMARLDHSSPRAAMIYQHATRDRDQAIARPWHPRPAGTRGQGQAAQGQAAQQVRCGPCVARPLAWPGFSNRRHACYLGRNSGAGDGNRTRMTSLEGWGSAIELRPRGGLAAPG